MHIICVQAVVARHMDNNITGKEEQPKTDINILLCSTKMQI
jgi:hypothetical protein